VVDQPLHEVAIRDGAEMLRFALRSQSALSSFVRRISGSVVYLDLTGLAHHVWAPILRALIQVKSHHVFGVYVEPKRYTLSDTPTEGDLYNLSEKIRGIKPLPGFAVLRREVDDACFVPLLGFEGTRFAHVLEQVQPSAEQTFPIVGVPGFRAEYPFIAIRGNQVQLEQDRYWLSIRLAAANCPFDVFHVLRDIYEACVGDFLKISPIGTKPHGLGAILFALSAPQHVELIYDNPVRTSQRTTGEARLCLYDVGTFIESDLFKWQGAFA
jgi:hypothetical protein